MAAALSRMALLAADTPADIHNEGSLYLTNDQSATWTVNNLIDGGGDLYKLGGGTLDMTTSASQYTGTTFVTQRIMTAREAGAPVDMTTSALNIASGTTFAGYGSVAGSVDISRSYVVLRASDHIVTGIACSSRLPLMG